MPPEAHDPTAVRPERNLQHPQGKTRAGARAITCDRYRRFRDTAPTRVRGGSVCRFVVPPPRRSDRVPGNGVAGGVDFASGSNYAVAAILLLVVLAGGVVLASRAVGACGLSRAIEPWER